MKYKFLKLDGSIIEGEHIRSLAGKDWETINRLKPLWDLTKSEHEFLKEYGLPNSIFNVACLQHLGMVYLFNADYERLKGGNKK